MEIIYNKTFIMLNVYNVIIFIYINVYTLIHIYMCNRVLFYPFRQDLSTQYSKKYNKVFYMRFSMIVNISK